MPSFKGIPTPPTSNTQKDLSTGLAGLLGGMFQGRRQKSQDALAQALQELNMKFKQREMQHMDVTEQQGQEVIDQNKLNQGLQRLHQMYPEAQGDLSILLDPSQPNSQPVGNRVQSGVGAQTPDINSQFGQQYNEAMDRMLKTHSTQGFDVNGHKITVAPQEYNPASMASLGERINKDHEAAARAFLARPDNKITMAIAGNFGRAYATLKSAAKGNPAAYNGALLNFASEIDPAMRQGQWMIQKQIQVDPSLGGSLDIMLSRLKDATLPVDVRMQMADHLKDVISGIMKEYDQRREGHIVTHPGWEQETYVPTSDQIFPMFQEFQQDPSVNKPQGASTQAKPSLQEGYRQILGTP